MQKIFRPLIAVFLLITSTVFVTGCQSDDKNIREHIVYGILSPDTVVIKNTYSNQALRSLINDTEITVESIIMKEGEITSGNTGIGSDAASRALLVEELKRGGTIIQELVLTPATPKAKNHLQQFLKNFHKTISLTIIQDAIKRYGRVITIDDFPQDKIYKFNDGDEIAWLGKSPEKAATPLVFDKNGILFTAQRYGIMQEKLHEKLLKRKEAHPDQEVNQEVLDELREEPIEIYVTDLTTFHSVTHFPRATPEYVGGIDDVALFDPYRTYFRKREDN